MRLVPFSLAALVVAFSAGSSLRSQGVPARYQEIAPSKFAKLVEVLGAPEQEPIFAHTAAFSRDGKLAVCASGGSNGFGEIVEDAFVSIWDVDKGTMQSEWRLARAGISALALAPDGHVLLGLVEADGNKKGVLKLRISVRELAGGKEIRSLGEKTIPVSIAVSPSGKLALAGCSDGSVRLWNLESGKEGPALAGHGQNSGPVSAVAFATDHLGLSSGQDGKVHVWDLKAGKRVQALTHGPGAIGLGLSKDGSRLASLSYDLTVKVWDLAKGTELKQWSNKQLMNGLGTIALSGDGKRVLVAATGPDSTGLSEESHLAMWEADTGKQLWSVKTAFKGLVPIHFEKALLAGGANPFTHWDLVKGKQLKAWGGHKGAISGVAVRSKAQRIYSAGLDGQLLRWTGTNSQPIGGHAGGIHALAVSASGKYVLTGGADKTVKYWECGFEERLLHTFPGHTAQVTGVALFDDGKLAVSASADRTLKIWDLKSGKETQTLTGHADAVNAVAVSPDGKWIASASDDNNVRLWPVKNGKAGESILLDGGHKRQVLTVAFSPDGKHLLSGSQDMTLKLWDVEEGVCVKTLEGHKNWVHCVVFQRNGQAVSASDDLTVRVWDLKQGKEVDQIDLGKSTDVARCLALDPDSSSLLVGTAGWTILRFELLKGIR